MNAPHQTTHGRVESPTGALATVDGRVLLSFGGSGYLGLGSEPGLIDAGCDALRTYGAHSQLARHYGFNLGANLEAEDQARRFFDVEGVMYFGAGYLFGLIALTGLAPRCDAIFIDEAAHYCLQDGASITGRPVHTFAHRDPEDLARTISRALRPDERPLVATDGMFATFGSIAPLEDYDRVIAPYDGWLVVDESHAFGTLGTHGRGAVEAAGLRRDRVVAGGSMAKAFAAHGGLALGAADVIAQLWKTPAARGAALGCSAGAAMTAASLRHVRGHPQALTRLRANARVLKVGLRALGLAVEENEGPIATFVHGDARNMQRIQAALMAQGIFIAYSTYVGAGVGGALRIAAFADHQPEHIERLLKTLRDLL
ncbi:pyridoxal phosphate-dependent aminotransferase family protein [Variovorax sp. E3]|uniref:aminotransferase class I/II-fold pyridoxal phosphate-dependent enzyme n=1 Tax=Variovorax sp. E3 TaxID=1914993 RepID=UPI0018DE1C14|nr:pyridoxal phosphate-dependent aminotransferase family protein [Variovorax sp. E3]